MIVSMLLMAFVAASPPVELNGTLYMTYPDARVEMLTDFAMSRGMTELNSSRDFDPNWPGRDYILHIYLEEGDTRVIYWSGGDSSNAADISRRLRQGETVAQVGEARFDQVYPGPMIAEKVTLDTFDDGRKLTLSLSAKPGLPTPTSIDVTEQSLGLNYFCLKDSMVIVDRHFAIAHLDGFVQFVELRSPELGDVRFSFVAKDDDRVVGHYDHGEIVLNHPAGHEILMTNVGIGPGGLSPEGPFNVYGQFREPTTTRERLVASQLSQAKEQFEGNTLQRVEAAIANSPFTSAGTTIGSSPKSSPQLRAFAGPLKSTLRDCGA